MPRSASTIDGLKELVEVLLRRRDELYSIAKLLTDQDQMLICRRIADQLGGHAADLLQVIAASGGRAGTSDEPSKLESRRDAAVTQGHLALATAAEFESELRARYDQVIECITDREIEGLLCKQRDEVEFCGCVLRSLSAVNQGQA